jgi:amino acid transporter
MSEAPRRLGMFDATMIVMGGIVGSGIFINPHVVARHVHTPFLILGVWLAGGGMAMLGAFIWAELATRLPGAGRGNICICAKPTIRWSRFSMDGCCCW